MAENAGDLEHFRAFWGPRVDAISIWKPHNFTTGRDYRPLDQGEKTTCGRPAHGPLQIQWDGSVIPCCFDYNNALILGNAFTTPVLDILNSTKYRLLRRAHATKTFGLFPLCNSCDQLLPHADALIYTNRHTLSPEDAVTRSNTDLYDLAAGEAIQPEQLGTRYRMRMEAGEP